MKLKVIGSNQTEVTIGGVIVFFSYNTPVACFASGVGNIPAGWYKSNKKFGRTTNKHINSWYLGLYQEKDQQFFDNLISGV